VSVCTPSESRVNEKLALATACVSNRVQPVHRLLTGFGATAPTASYRKATLNSPLSRKLHLPGSCWSRILIGNRKLKIFRVSVFRWRL
jgi:hypothetical protein